MARLMPGTFLLGSLKFWVISSGVVVVTAALYWYLRHIATEAAIFMTGFPAIREMVIAHPP